MGGRIYSMIIIPIVLLVIFDQISKFYVAGAGRAIFNRGFAFSLFEKDAGVPFLLSVFALAVFILFMKKHSGNVGFWLVVGGGVSNILDRVIWGGAVVDFIKLPIVPNLPVFNLADGLVVFGLMLMGIGLVKGSRLSDQK